VNIKTARLNPLGVNANSKAALKRIITDKVSAQNVAEYLIAHPEKVKYQQQDLTAGLRRQWRFIKTLTKQNTRCLNQLESLLYIANPELLIYFKDDSPMWLLNLLKKYPTASLLSRAKAETAAKIPFITIDRAEKLVGRAGKSVASAADPDIGRLIKSIVRQIIDLKKTIKSQTEYMAEQCTLPEAELLKTFPGIGDLSAIGLMLEIQTVKRFSSVKKLSSFFGLHPEYKISGDGSSGFKMSKKGRKEPRHILYMVTMASLTHNPLIREIYQNKVEKGMKNMAAMGLCMHKILRIIYGMLKNNTPFDPETDRKNREREFKSASKIGNNKNRRYQDYDSEAPISKRQSKKRKEQQMPHSVKNAENSTPASIQAAN
jgi:transposase